MHIVHCLSRSVLGGGPALVYSLVRGIRGRYSDVRQSVLLPGGGVFVDQFRSLGVHVHEIPFDRITPNAFLITPDLLKSLRPSIIHSHGRGAGLYTRLAAIGGGVARVHTYHGVHRAQRRFQQFFLRHLEMTLLRRTTLVISVSKGESVDVHSEYSFSGEKTITIENEIDDAALDQASHAQLTQDQRLFFRKHHRPFVVVMIGRDDPVKNYPLAVESARRTLAQSSKIVFAFIGTTSANSMIEGLRSQFPDHVLNAGELANPLPLLLKADCLMMTSKKEGRSLTILEAQYFGKPVIATNVEGIREMVRSGVNGMLCAEDAASISETILRLSKRGKEWSELMKSADSHHGKRTFVKWIDQYMKQYRMLSDGIATR